MAADQVVTALLGAFDAQSNERAASQEALQGWEGMPGYTPLLLQLYAAPPPRLTPDARLLAVVCLKNAVTRHWNARRAGVPAVPDADKAVLRAGLLQTLDEPEPRLSAQLLLLLAQARASPASLASQASFASPAGSSRPMLLSPPPPPLPPPWPPLTLTLTLALTRTLTVAVTLTLILTRWRASTGSPRGPSSCPTCCRLPAGPPPPPPHAGCTHSTVSSSCRRRAGCCRTASSSSRWLRSCCSACSHCSSGTWRGCCASWGRDRPSRPPPGCAPPG